VFHPPTVTAVKGSQITVIKGLTSQASETISHYLTPIVIAWIGVNASKCKRMAFGEAESECNVSVPEWIQDLRGSSP